MEKLIEAHAFIYRATFNEIDTSILPVDPSIATNPNISYGALWGNLCESMPKQAVFETIRNTTNPFDVCFHVTVDTLDGSGNLQDTTGVNFHLGFIERTT